MFNKGYGGKWITVAGTAAFQRKKGRKEQGIFLRIIHCFILVLRLSDVYFKQVIPHSHQYPLHPLTVSVPAQ